MLIPKLLKSLAVLPVALSLAFPAHAAVTSATSGGEALSVGVDVLGLPFLTADVSEVQDSTPGAYSVSETVISLNLPLNLGLASANLNTGVLTGSASFDGATAYGYGGIETLNLGVGTLLGSILSLSLDSIYSSSSVTGDWGNLSATGDSTLANAKLWLLGSSLTLDAHPAANTHIDLLGTGLLGAIGVHLILNEQIESCSSFACSIETNALHLWVDPLNVGLANVEIILGHSMAEVTAVPEPSNMALLLAGLGLVGFVTRKRLSR